ncbi:hypothetical protein BH11PSE14_BH11PSE14_03870 [soil metagenome]
MTQNKLRHPLSPTKSGPADGGNVPEDAQAKFGWTRRQLVKFFDYRESHKKHPFLALTLAAFVLLVGFIANDVYIRAKGMIWKGTDHLAELAKEQKQAFAELKNQLGQLSSSINADDRAAFRSVRNAVDAMENTNVGLIQQLVLAKQENETLRKVSQQTAGVSGGYDFILTEGSGIRLDATTVLGVNRVSPTWATVNLTSASAAEPVRKDLQNGESLAYRSASGKACKVSLLSTNSADVGSASFAIGCTS